MARRTKTVIKFKIPRITIFITSVVLLIYILDIFLFPIVENKETFDRELFEDISLRREIITNITPVFVITICDGSKESTKLGDNLRRQTDQSYVLLKSAALLTNKPLRFIILVDQNYIYKDLLTMMRRWPKNMKKKILLEKRNVSYPENGNFIGEFRSCASERLFLNEVLLPEDAVVYLDTDIIFLKSPESLWEEFSLFNSDQLSGLAPSLYFYHRFYSFPIYGKSGLNSGVWMMNLTRIRNFPGGWTKTVLKTANDYKKRITLFDQDIANIIFSKNPKYLYELSCRWNYRDNICHLNKHPCRRVELTGIFLLHGSSLKFYINHNLKFKVMFKEFFNFDMNQPLEELLQSIKTSLKNIDYKINTSRCSNLDKIDEMLTKSLEKTISQRI